MSVPLQVNVVLILAYNMFCIFMRVRLNIGNFNTAYFREFRSPMQTANSKSNLCFLRPVLSCCHSDRVPFNHGVATAKYTHA